MRTVDLAGTPLRELNAAFSNGQTISLAYFEAALLVEHITETHGQAGINKLVRIFTQGLDTEAALDRLRKSMTRDQITRAEAAARDDVLLHLGAATADGVDHRVAVGAREAAADRCRGRARLEDSLWPHQVECRIRDALAELVHVELVLRRLHGRHAFHERLALETLRHGIGIAGLARETERLGQVDTEDARKMSLIRLCGSRAHGVDFLSGDSPYFGPNGGKLDERQPVRLHVALRRMEGPRYR